MFSVSRVGDPTCERDSLRGTRLSKRVTSADLGLLAMSELRLGRLRASGDDPATVALETAFDAELIPISPCSFTLLRGSVGLPVLFLPGRDTLPSCLV